MDTIVTDWYRLKPGACVRAMTGEWFARWWWCLALPFALLAIASMYDIRYLIIALMLLFIVVPGIMALVYFAYALRPLTASSILVHRVIFAPDALTVEYRAPEHEKADGDACSQDSEIGLSEAQSQDSGITDTDPTDAEPVIPATVKVSWHDVAALENTGSNLLVRFTSDPRDLLLVPLASFPDRDSVYRIKEFFD